VAIAKRLREETTVTLAWIAERLKIGGKTHLAHFYAGNVAQLRKSNILLTDPVLTPSLPLLSKLADL
jgi:hypothetical protein